MAFWRCFYHVVWATKRRAPHISNRIEPLLFEVIENKSKTLQCSVLALNAVPDHVHIAVTIPPKLAVAGWVKEIKGTTSHLVNEHFPDLPDRFYWQIGYGVLTFGFKNLQWVSDYIASQKQHHAHNTAIMYMERMGEEE